MKRPASEDREDSRARKRVKHERTQPPSFNDSDDEKEPEVEASDVEDFEDVEDDDNDLGQQMEFNFDDDTPLTAGGKEMTFGPCYIKEINIQNFRGVSQLTVKPGPGINLVIAPNGGGKSSILLAIYCACGGKPEKVIKANNYDDWIMQGKNSARVTLRLTKPEALHFDGAKQSIKSDVQIILYLERGKNPRWLMRYRNKFNFDKTFNVKKGQLLKLMESFNIRASNPCQFLPQEKVSAFANLHPKKRLIETLKTEQTYLYEKYGQLQQLYKHRNETQIELDRKDNNLNSLKEKEELLKARLGDFNQRTSLLQEKNGLVAFKQVLQFLKYKSERQALKIAIREYEAQLVQDNEKKKPFLDRLEAAEKDVDAAKRGLEGLKKAMRLGQKELKNIQNLVDKEEEKFPQLEASLDEYLTEKNRTEEQLVQKQHELVELKGKFDEMVRKSEEYKPLLASVTQKFEELKDKKNSHATEGNAFREIFHKASNERKKALRDKQAIETRIKHTKGKILNYHEHTKKLFNEVEKLKLQNKFSGEVFGPVGYYISLHDKKYATVLEHNIGNKLHMGFIVDNFADAQVLRTIMTTLKLERINVYVQDTMKEPNYVGDETLIRSKGGIYLCDCYDAPDLVKSFLIDSCRLDSVAYFDDENLDGNDLIKQTKEDTRRPTRVCVKNTMYSVRFSRYDGSASSRMSEIRSKNMLSASERDMDRVRQLQDEVSQHAQDEQTALRNFEEYKKKYEAICEEVTNARMERDKVFAMINNPNIYQTKVQQLETDIKQLQNLNFDKKIDMARKNIERCLERWFKNTKSLAEKTKTHVQRKLIQTKMEFQMQAGQILEDASRAKLKSFTKRMGNYSEKVQSQMAALEHCEKLMQRQKEEVNRVKAKFDSVWTDLSCVSKYNVKGLSAEEKMDNLERDIRGKNTEIGSLLVEEGIQEKYENLMFNIKRATKEKEEAQQKHNQIDEELVKVDEVWTPKVKEFIREINDNFRDLLANFCSEGAFFEGRVRLVDNPEKNYEKYELNVDVKISGKDQGYRSLSGGSHSGGEQSFLTMSYILALQSVAKLPFRVIDEINQGMDAENERRIIHLVGTIVHKNQQQRETPPQMFLFSPTLLHNMNWGRFANQIRYHVIMNGPFNALGGAEWNQMAILKKNIEYLVKKQIQDQNSQAKSENVHVYN